MAQNRYLPYGYKIESGKTVIELQEAEIIRRIYNQYAEGLSYKKIAELLTQSGVRYMPDKPQWNKNMVARILQNQSYLGTGKYPAILTAGRSRRISVIPIIQSFAQLDKNYGKEGSEIITDNCQLTIFGGFAPNSETAQVLSKALVTFIERKSHLEQKLFICI